MEYAYKKIRIKKFNKPIFAIKTVHDGLTESNQNNEDLKQESFEDKERSIKYECEMISEENIDNRDIKLVKDSNTANLRIYSNHDYFIKIFLEDEISKKGRLFIDEFIKYPVIKKNEYISGVLNTSNYIGVLNLEAFDIFDELVEIITPKMNYYRDYEDLVEGITDFFSELVTRGSSFFETRFEKEDRLIKESQKYYSQIAYIKYILEPERFPIWIHNIIREPNSDLYTTLEEDFIWNIEELKIDELIAAFSEKSERLGSEIENVDLLCPAEKLPIRLNNYQYEDTINTIENRFIKFFIKYLRDIVDEILQYIQGESKVYYELKECLVIIDYFYNHSFFSEINELEYIPFDSQVLQNKYPYNRIFHAYNNILLTSDLSHDTFDKDFLVGQKDVPKLYEYWVFLKIFGLLNRKFNNDFKTSDWITYDKKKLNITLNKKGVKKVNYEFNSNIKINLYYNKEYKKTSKFKKGKSYSHTLNPDISLELFKNDDLFGILHFDSKYKMTESGQFKTEDLNKMHAYKDAIIGSYGSYILGPLEDDINIFTSEEQSNGKRFPSVGAISFQINNCAKGLNNFWNLVEEFIDMADNSD